MYSVKAIRQEYLIFFIRIKTEAILYFRHKISFKVNIRIAKHALLVAVKILFFLLIQTSKEEILLAYMK